MEILQPNLWVDKYADYLYNYTIVRVNDHVVAQDIISDTFLAALKSSKNFKGEATERTWLISILKRKIIDYYRKINSKKGKAEIHINYKNEDSEGDWLEENAADPFDKTAEDTLENEELGLAILDCLDKLDKRQAEIFKLKTVEGFDTDAICKEYNITPSNLWVIIHRARKTLMECLNDNWFNK
ncbi:sigma-70 family RNA polymerase sigma factor [Aequorivita echinoideorum]|uniref:Sigma-70 family RNA polymerase sigma factor n=1 Tax=Aequorivita echinoideorum TaxID=1549647 RepID=A0ABS5S4X3_9FLAO|nr:sigma-70 family RNA polymerase sigma factor [Aequorivita echinoideorum]MBT0607470.1 sigma-70 family RNA polymerase sigma factor [Aequorivita echinoideorum]